MAVSRVFVVALVLTSLTAACGGSTDTPSSPTPSLPRGEYATTDLRVGTGTEALIGNRATVHYTLWLYDPAQPENKGQRMESSRDAGRTPFQLTAGGSDSIPGFSRAVVGMKVGGERRVTVPPELAYGASGSGPIRPNQSLVFEIELVSIP
jgi:FKBP-type peptidyl-prolyl cis-trans isomerase